MLSLNLIDNFLSLLFLHFVIALLFKIIPSRDLRNYVSSFHSYFVIMPYSMHKVNLYGQSKILPLQVLVLIREIFFLKMKYH